MRSICLETRWRPILEEMFIELSWCWQTLLPEVKKVERAYHISQQSWIRTKDLYREDYFQDDEEEICFFRDGKPKFTSEMGYYSLLYNTLLYGSDDKEQQKRFWEQETKRFSRFRNKHKDFVHYYESGDRSRDESYFLQRNVNQFPPPVRMLYDSENELFSARDHLVTGYLTEQRYRAYANTMCCGE